MTQFRVPIEIADATESAYERMDALVDTGSAFSWVLQDVLGRLGHSPEQQWEFELADGRRVPYGVKWIRMRLNGDAQPMPIIFGNEGTEPLLGMVSLEIFRLAVDGVNERLFPVPARLKVSSLRRPRCV